MNARNKTELKPLSQALNSVLENLGLKKAVSRQSVIHRWPYLVDAVIAKHAKIERISGDTLFVMVDSAVWMSELSAMKPNLLERVNRSLDSGAAKFRDIRFSQRSWAESRQVVASVEPEINPPDEKHLRAVHKILEPLKDESFRDIINRIIEKDRRLKAVRSRITSRDKI